jgi:hypothetical protein
MGLEAARAVSGNAGATATQDAAIGRPWTRPRAWVRILAVRRLEQRSLEEAWR